MWRTTYQSRIRIHMVWIGWNHRVRSTVSILTLIKSELLQKTELSRAGLLQDHRKIMNIAVYNFFLDKCLPFGLFSDEEVVTMYIHCIEGHKQKAQKHTSITLHNELKRRGKIQFQMCVWVVARHYFKDFFSFYPLPPLFKKKSQK